MEATVDIKQGEQLYEGKAKILYATDHPDLVIQYFKDDATAFNAQKRGTIVDKGVCNNKISAALFEVLEEQGVDTHFVQLLSDREMLVQRLEIILIEVTVRNIVAGGLAKRLGLDEGMHLDQPMVEYHYKRDDLDDPLMTEDDIQILKLADPERVAELKRRSLKINEVLSGYLAERGVDLVDFKLEFGTNTQGALLLGDEISPDTCRFWEQGTQRKLDKDRFRRDLGSIEEAYQEMLRRIVGES